MYKSYKDLLVWQKSLDFVEKLYKNFENFPKTEQFALVDQLKRASISIPSNIAEWYGRGTTKNCLQFLYIARWSITEVKTQITIAHRLWFFTDIQFISLNTDIEELSKMITWLIKSLLQKNPDS